MSCCRECDTCASYAANTDVTAQLLSSSSSGKSLEARGMKCVLGAAELQLPCDTTWPGTLGGEGGTGAA